MSYTSLYHSPWHNPGLFVLTNVLLIGFLTLRKLRKTGAPDVSGADYLRRLSLVFAVLAIVDACLTGEKSPIPGAILTYVAIPFVILGDVRFFFLLERYGRQGGSTGSAAKLFGRSVAWGLIVPASAYATKMLFYPERTLQWLFLTYECFFTVLAFVLNTFVLPKWLNARNIAVDQKRWVQSIALFELAFYALWASADVGILSGHEEGYLLRMVPNIMYYSVFGWFVVLTAPRSVIWGFGSPSAPFAPNPKEIRP